MKKKDIFHRILELLNRLREAKITCSLRQIRDDALMVDARVPGQRWEIEFVSYGDEVQIEIERFISNGRIDDENALAELWTKFSDKEEDSPVRKNEHTRRVKRHGTLARN